MIDLQRNCSSADRQPVCIKVIGLGSAGSAALDRLILDGIGEAEGIAMNTDAQALASSIAPQKVQLGRSTTRGLGAGGDPEVGYSAGEESLDDIRSSVEGAQLVFLCVGLGGGTGSGGARLVASVARQAGAFVVAFATLPFTFEGRRRMNQAEEALQALQSACDVVICFENDRMGDSVSPRAGIQEAFTVADQTISQSLSAVAALARQRGVIRLGFDELATALRSGGRGASRCLFGFGEAEGDNRAHEALARALRSPLMEKGRMLEEAHSVLINVSGGTSLTLNEVQILMEEFGRHVSDQTQILFGASVDPHLGPKLNVTLITSIGTAQALPVEVPRPAARGEASEAAPSHAAASTSRVSAAAAASGPAPDATAITDTNGSALPASDGKRTGTAANSTRQSELSSENSPPAFDLSSPPAPARSSASPDNDDPAPQDMQEKQARRRQGADLAPAPAHPDLDSTLANAGVPGASGRDASRAAAASAAKKAREAKQEQMQFEPVTRGRFEKSEPYIVDGQDLDVPTFLRRNMKVK